MKFEENQEYQKKENWIFLCLVSMYKQFLSDEKGSGPISIVAHTAAILGRGKFTVSYRNKVWTDTFFQQMVRLRLENTQSSQEFESAME